MTGPNKETEYILGEIQHLNSCGVRPDQIAKQLGRPKSSLSKLLYRHGLNDLGNKFARVGESNER